MNALLRTTLVRTAFVASGAVAGAGGTVALTSGAHESVRMTLGDSIVPKFSVRTDTVLKVVGSNIVANRCGNSMVFLRTFYRGAQLTADSISVEVPCAPPPVDTTTKAASVDVCFIPTDSAVKYNIDGGKSLDSATAALIQPWCKKTDTLQLAPTSTPLTRKAGDAEGVQKHDAGTPSRDRFARRKSSAREGRGASVVQSGRSCGGKERRTDRLSEP